jgi:hypothetical protein
MSDFQESDKQISENVGQDSRVQIVDKYVYNIKMLEKLNVTPFCCFFVRYPRRIDYTGHETLNRKPVNATEISLRGQ